MSNFDDQRQKAFDYCADLTKQLITLATGIVALTITFAKDFVSSVPSGARHWAYLAWFFYLLSVMFGIGTLGALTSQLEPKHPADPPELPSIRGPVQICSLLQSLAFIVAIALTIVFGVKAIPGGAQRSAATPHKTPTPVRPTPVKKGKSKEQGKATPKGHVPKKAKVGSR